MFLLVVSAKSQNIKNFYTFDKFNNTLEFDISKIAKFEQRTHFLYLLNNDGRFDVSASEKDGFFIVKRNENSYSFNLEDVFERFYREEISAFNSMSKDEVGELYGEWKSSLPDIFIASMMMDVYVKDRQNNLCANADPFCTDNGIYQFPAGVNAGSGEQGPNYNCLNSTPNPAWYYMRMNTSGGMTIYMYSTPSEDIDFCCWGPFDDPTAPCPTGLTGGKVVSCSYSANPTENCIIPTSAQTGEYYILVITNYSNHACNITFSKTAGTGTTDCSILEPFLTANTPCYGSSLVLEANVIEGATYNWTSPDGQTHNGRTWTRTNATLSMSGTYSCHVTAGAQSGNENIDVVVLPNVIANFNYTEATVGVPVQFTGTETTNPAGHNSEITARQWSFGDGTTSTEVNPTHTYTTAGDYQVTYIVEITGGNHGNCGDSKTRTIQIRNEFGATVTTDGTDFCDGNAIPNLTATASGGFGNYTYSWTSSPHCTIDYPNSATTTAHPALGTTTFTCTISDGHSSLTRSVDVTVHPIPDVTITGPNPPHVNFAQTATLSVPEMAGATYEWTSEPANLIQSGQGTNEIHTASLTVPTTFYVTVSKNGCSDSNSFTIAVGDALYGNVVIVGQDELCSGETTSLKVNPSGGTEQYSFDWQPASLIEGSNTTQVVTTTALTQSVAFTCTITDTDNHTFAASSPQIIVNPIPEASAYILQDDGETFKTYSILAGNYVYLTMNEIPGATYSWEPADLINNFIDETHRVAKTINLPENENTVFTATVTTASGCSNQDDLVVKVYKSLENSYISASNTETCEDFEVTLTANPDGGTGRYTYHWTPEEYYSDPYSQTTTVHPNVYFHSYTCLITDEGIDDHVNNNIEKTINIGMLEKPSVNADLIGQSMVTPGIDYMPFIYEYNIQVSSLHGYDIENAAYTWELFSFYDTPNHVAGTDYTSSWQIFADEADKNKAYVSVEEEGNALLICTITTICGTTTSRKFIYTEGYEEGVSVEEVDYEKMISIFPNPSNGELYIGYSDILMSTPLTISIFSYNGMLIDQIKGDMSNNVTQYSTDGLANGMYLIRITGSDFVVTKKYVLNR